MPKIKKIHCLEGQGLQMTMEIISDSDGNLIVITERHGVFQSGL